MDSFLLTNRHSKRRKNNMRNYIIVGIGGFIGAVSRYFIGTIPLKEGSAFPIKTFLINLIGSFFIGMIAALAAKHSSMNPKIILFLKVGFCGGFTTFSSFALETSELIEKNNLKIGLLYPILSITLGVLCVFAGETIVRVCFAQK